MENIKPHKPVEAKRISVKSPAFSDSQEIPERFTCDGINVLPSLHFSNFPDNTKSLAMIVDDPDAPSKVWVHYVTWNIPLTSAIEEGTVPGEEGLNDFKKNAWSGPCPPSGTHRYFFKLYALDTLLDLPSGTTKPQLEKAMNGHILGYGELIGLYSKK